VGSGSAVCAGASASAGPTTCSVGWAEQARQKTKIATSKQTLQSRFIQVTSQSFFVVLYIRAFFILYGFITKVAAAKVQKYNK
jgi:hypothetical protein